MDTPTKRCRVCGLDLPLDNFRPHRYTCRRCTSIAEGHVPREELPEGMRRCITCHTLYPTSDQFFFHDKNRLYGLSYECKQCITQRTSRPRSAYTPILIKRCRVCNMELPIDEFRRNGRRKDGHDTLCKTCRSIQRGHNPMPRAHAGMKRCSKCRAEKPATKEFYCTSARQGFIQPCKDCMRIYRQQHKAQYHEYVRKYRDLHRDHVRNMRRIHHRNNPEKHRHYVRMYRLRHPDRVRNGEEKRRATERALPLQFTEQEWINCLNYWHSICVYCGNPPGLFPSMQLSIEHFVAVTDPRPDNPGTVAENILPACVSCNASRGNRDVWTWLVNRYGKRKAKTILKRIEDYFAYIRSQR